MNAIKALGLKRIFCLVTYYIIATHLPSSSTIMIGRPSKWLRYILARNIFKSCGINVNIERHARFGSGKDIVIGNNSGIGINCSIPSNSIIGENVMMAANVIAFEQNHETSNTDIPMNIQGFSTKKQLIIEDDVWIGYGVIITPGRKISKGSIVAAGTVLSKNFPEYSVIGGNPSCLIKNRKNDSI